MMENTMRKLLLLPIFLPIFCFAKGRIQNEDVKTLSELTGAGGTMAQLINDTKIYVTANSLNQQLSTAISNGALGGGGGGSLQWNEGANAPAYQIGTTTNTLQYLFTSGLGQSLYTSIKVPHRYGGTQIKLRIEVHSPDSSGTALMQSVATLVRSGVDTYTSTTNQRTSTNSAITLSGGTANIPQIVTLDLTDTSGKINGVSVSGDDIIFVNLFRGSDSGASDLRVNVSLSEVATN